MISIFGFFLRGVQILFDFGLFFPSIDTKALHKMWNQLLATPISDWKDNVDMSIIPAKDDNIWKLFVLFDKFKNSRSRFYTNIKSLIVFSTVKHLYTHIYQRFLNYILRFSL